MTTKYPHLNNYLQDKNFMADLFKQPRLDIPETQGECYAILDMIDCDMSPENLTCDGERSAYSVAKRRNELNGAYNEVQAIIEKMGGIY